MTPDEIEACIRLVERHGIAEFSIERGGQTLLLRAGSMPGPGVEEASAPPPAPGSIRAPCAGVFQPTHPSTGECPVVKGATVAAGQVVAFLAVGPCLRPVQAPAGGTLGPALAEAGALVGFGAALFHFAEEP